MNPTDFLFIEDLVTNQVGDLRLSTDKKQAIIIRLKTPYGSNAFHPNYGNRIFDILSENIDDNWVNMACAYEKECVEQDESIKVVRIEPAIVREERKAYFKITYRDLETSETDEVIWGENIG